METESSSEVPYFGTGHLLPRKTLKKEYKLWTWPLQKCLHAVSTTGCGSFVQEVSISSGECYHPRSLYTIICGLKRHQYDVNGSAALNPLDMSDRR